MIRKMNALLLALIWPAIASAQPNAWSFDFDPNIAANPAHVNKHLAELKLGLPGLPPDADIVEATTGPVKLYFFTDVIDMLTRARDSGPAILPPVTRTPTICVQHGSFIKPDLGASGDFFCKASENAVMSAFDKKKVNTCFHVEFPESYVYDHEPIGFADIAMVSNWNTLISLIGEALTYIDYPQGLMPADFMPTMRNVLAKLRYTELKAQIGGAIAAYQNAIAKLQTDILCYDQAKVQTFTSTVNAMVAELTAMEQQLDGIYKTGVTQAAADRKAVENKGRIRTTLPFPALTDRDRELLAFYVAAVTWRIRGGGLLNINRDSSLLTRLLYVQYPFQLIAELAGGIPDAKDVGFQIFIDASGGYKDWFDMGNWGGNDKYSDLVEMTKRGKRATSLAAPTLQSRGFDTRALVAGGLQMGLCYYYVWEELYEVTPVFTGFALGQNLHDRSIYPSHLWTFLEQPISTAEPCTGGALALGLVRTYLWGKSGGTVCNPDCTGKPCGADDNCGTPCGTSCPSPDSGASDSDAPLDAPPLLDDAGNPIDSDSPPPVTEAGVPMEAGAEQPPTADASDGCSCQAGDSAHAASCLTLILALLLAYRRR